MTAATSETSRSRRPVVPAHPGRGAEATAQTGAKWGRLRRAAALVAAALTWLIEPSASIARDSVRAVIIDAGHGGDDTGAVGYSGLPEKDVCLKLALQLGEKFEEAGVQVIYTRTTDDFVSLADRTAIANFTKADLFISIHANASEDEAVRGPETYFLSIDASDEDAYRVALTENEVFKGAGAGADGGDIAAPILADLIRAEHMLVSSRVASSIQRELGKLPGPSRGVKQAPFIVLSGVNMPAVLLELGFLTNVLDADNLRRPSYRSALADGVVRAVLGLPVIDRTPEITPASAEPRTGDAAQ